jgi:site-specific recombinase XerD
MMEAETDADAIATFLQEYRKAKLTHRSYLKEIERLVLWCTHVENTTISDLKREHLVKYRAFLEDPQPKAAWCGPRAPRLLKDGSPNPKWRPFASPLSGPTIRKSISILDSFFNYLVQNNYLSGNPMAVDKRKKGEKSRSTDRWLEKDEINATLQALDRYLQQHPEKLFQVHRAKYVLLTLFYTGLRLAELTNHRMGDFSLIENEWYLTVTGKGQKERRIVVVDEYLDVLSHFRKSLGLDSPLPTFQENTPLVSALNKKDPLSESRIWQIVKWAFNLGASYLENERSSNDDSGTKHAHKASKLRKASPHWLRHSYGTYLVKSGCPIEKVKALMGHSDISTTMVYVHIANNDLHASARHLSLDSDD